MAITTSGEFSQMISALARENRCGVMEALNRYCEEHFLEPEEIKSLISGPLKDRLRIEFEEINMLKPQPKFDV